MRYVIDRFEGSFAVLEDDEENHFNIEKSLLPDEARENDVIDFDGSCYKVNAEETEKRRQANIALLRKMGLI